MEDLKFQERIGDYTIIKSGEIIIFNNQPIEIDVLDSTTTCIRIEFEYGNKNFSIKERFDKSVHVLKFSNMDVNLVYGVFEPIDIAELDNNKILYIIASVIIFDSNKGNGVLKYSLLTK